MEFHSYKTMTEAVRGLKSRGYRSNFEFLKNTLRDIDSGRIFKANELTIVEHHRFEGMSDPDDESIVYAIESDDGIRGVLVDAFGIYANPELERFLEPVRIQEGR